MSLRERFLSLLRLAFLGFVLVSAAFLSAITAMRFAIRGQEVSVPKVVGLSLRDATRLLQQRNLQLKIEEEQYSSEFAAGAVIRQAPPMGTHVKVTQRVRVIVSRGPQRVTVPELAGESLRAAQIALLKSGLELGDVARAHVPGAEPDEIVVQQPAGSTQATSPHVNLLVSLGPATPAYVMPDLIGKNMAATEVTLRDAGLKVGGITPVSNPSVPKDTILRQSPGPGERVVAGAAVDFQIAR